MPETLEGEEVILSPQELQELEELMGEEGDGDELFNPEDPDEDEDQLGESDYDPEEEQGC